MGSDNAPLMCQTAPSKQLSWIDCMYQKLESVCVEIDKNPSLLLQETTKYVENRMNVVGTNMRKLCAEIIQDLLPPSTISSDESTEKPDHSLQCHCDILSSSKPKLKRVDSTSEISVDADSQNANLQLTQENGSAVPKECDCNLKTLAVEKLGIEQDYDPGKRVEIDYEKKATCETERSEGQALVGENICDHCLKANIIATDFSSCPKDKDYSDVHEVTVEQAEQDQEQQARWFVSEEGRLLSSSTFINFRDNDLQVEGCQAEIESGWELI